MSWSWLEEKLGQEITVQSSHPVSGGCINTCTALKCDKGHFFIKQHHAAFAADMFEKEAMGLMQLKEASRQSSIYVPSVILQSEDAQGQAFLLLEWIAEGRKKSGFDAEFGRSLAMLHQQSADQFGLDYDNYIGSLEQSNRQHSDWADFYCLERILPILEIGVGKAYFDKSRYKNAEQIGKLIENSFPAEQPALLHGDLWSGNYMCDAENRPVLIDPAVHYGNRETEIAFTLLFGGFGPEFYEAYNVTFPLAENFQERMDVHQLYPLLVHAILFGGGYIQQCEQILKRYA